jgi:hypothetical protein
MLILILSADYDAPAPSTSTNMGPPPPSVKTVSESFALLKPVHQRVENLPKSIPLTKNMASLASFGGDPVSLTQGTPNLELWEAWDCKLNALIPQAIPELSPLVTHGKYRLIGLV